MSGIRSRPPRPNRQSGRAREGDQTSRRIRADRRPGRPPGEPLRGADHADLEGLRPIGSASRASSTERFFALALDVGDPARYFVVQYLCVEIHSSAHRHGVAEEDMLHAIEHSLVVDDVGDDPNRWLVLGPDTAGNVLELVVLISLEGDEIIIHAMPMRPKYRRLLER